MEWCVRFTDIKRIVSDIQGECEENDYVLAVAELLIASWVAGTDVSTLSSFTGQTISFVEEVAAGFCASGVWPGGKAVVEPWMFEDCALPFWLKVYDAVLAANAHIG